MANIEGMQAAVNTVFDNKELREMVLIELPMQDIFRLQRVSKAWHSNVTDKKAVHLQRKLYLCRDPNKKDIRYRAEEVDVDLNLFDTTDVNLLLKIKTPIWTAGPSDP